MMKTILILADGTQILAGKKETNAIQSVSIVESSNNGEDLSFGSVCAKKIDIKIITPQNKLQIKTGSEFVVYEEENGNRHKKGHFIAEKPQKKGANTTNIIAYDNISRLDKDITEWFNSLDNFPYTAIDMARMTCEQCGITLENSSINNGDFLIQETKLKSVTGRQIIGWVGEICGCFCVANENGEIVYKWYVENNIPIVSNRQENGTVFLNGSLSYEDYEIKKINRVQIREDKKSVGIIYPNGEINENSYVIEGNPFLIEDARTVAIAEFLYKLIKDTTYTPCKVSLPSSYIYNVGDIINIKDANGVEIRSYVMQKSRKGQIETIECFGNYERNGASYLYDTSYTAGYENDLIISKDIAQLKLSVDKNSAEIALKASIGDITGEFVINAINNESTAKISADKINLTGIVTVESLGKYGTTEIDGARIRTGTIAAIDMSACNFYGGSININDNFKVNSWGDLTANSAELSGTFFNVNGDDTVKIANGGIELTKYLGSYVEGALNGAFFRSEDPVLNYSYFQVGIIPSLSKARCGLIPEGPVVSIITPSIEFTEHSATLLGSTWLNQSGQAITSDENKKNTILPIAENYDAFFDNLIPVTYKYNDGTSGRLHIGYTTQGVCKALENAEMTTDEFAGYIQVTTINDKGEKENFGALRYNEFVSLNTWQIQKLKERVKAIEKKLENIKEIDSGAE